MSAKKSILDEFKDVIKKSDKPENIISFLSVTNARLLAKIGTNQVDEDLKKEIIEFYNFFMENYEAETRKARKNNWPNDALVLRMGSEFAYEDYQNNIKNKIDSFPSDILQEAEILNDIIFGFRKDKILTLNHNTEHIESLSIPRTIPREYLNDSKETVLLHICELIDTGGSIVVRLMDKKANSVFGVLCAQKKWFPIPKNNMEWCHNHDTEGNPLEPEQNLTFIEIKKPEVYQA